MRLRRCKTLFFEPRSKFSLDLPSLVDGGCGLARTLQWIAYAGHLSAPVELSCDEIDIVANISEVEYVDCDVLYRICRKNTIDKLISLGILITDNSNDDAMSRTIPWHPLAEIYYMHGRWNNVHLQSSEITTNTAEVEFISPNNIIPPAYLYERNKNQTRLDLDTPESEFIDSLLDNRETCRNFDGQQPISKHDLSKIVFRALRARRAYTLENGLEVVHKTSPAGGGIHATEAYILVRNVIGINPGVYHYLPTKHSLEVLMEHSVVDIDDTIDGLLAGQDWFKNASVYIVMTARFERLFWKYRNHSKAFRVCNLDAGHISQMLYISATELNLGVFVSAAVNDRQIEKLLSIDPLKEGVIAVVGLGPKQRQLDQETYQANKAN